MEKKHTKRDADIEEEMQKLRDGFLMLKKNRKILQQKIDVFKQ